ncbi:MAG: hypothetical protein IT428_19180 [Planctomycetaceae bacterium]|nr:hypothetical protein [Planctomycetaceae bacterium]
MPDGPDSNRGLLLTSNLFFSSKVTGTAQALGLAVDAVMRTDQVAALVATGKYRCLFIDLGLPGLDIGKFIPSLPAERPIRRIAFGPHVETALFEAARAAGCDEVLPHSRFSGQLPELLRNELS